ncbi:MAG: hypothetical protein IJN29_06525 [Akkermansia sp.]|nr:hypothetical protein [Akkermansia sp.]
MKRHAFLFTVLTCGASLLQAADTYDITLTNAQKYTDCRISYESGSKTKFTGKDKSGKEVTLTVNTSSILMKKEVEEKPAPAENTEEPTAPETPTATETPATEEATAAEGETPTEATAPEGSGETKPAEEAAIMPSDAEMDKAKDVSLKLREKLAAIDTELASLSNPSRSLVAACKNSKSTIERRLETLDKLAIDVAELQTKFNQVSGGDYVFKHVSSDDRDKYMREGKAAHDAMLVDVKEYKNARKVGGLDKFEILRDRYQGIPEYKEAYKWYISTLKNLQKRWTNLLNAETKKRNRLNSAKQADMRKKDTEAYNKLEAYFEKNGEQIAKVWYTPDNRNIVMLEKATNKVRDALRRNEKGLQDEAIGTVPDILQAFWENMDKARTLMISGDLPGAEETLKEDPNYNKILKLNRSLLPEEYKTPIRAQRMDLEQEIKRRTRERNSLEGQLERKIAQLENSTKSAESQIDALLERIAHEKEVDVQNSTVEIDEKKPEPAKPATENKAKEPKPADKAPENKK